ncbi:transporter [uncultured Lacinutrix sp.]|uniref:transporter n=1 Tax=uncultured Lacinutrix sp. TaxID=574032 RepID=UPI00261704D2|nr:transporter [uncultured Lacinutrix sp.]
MKNLTKITLILSVIYFTSISQTNAQGLVDGFFTNKGEANFSLSYSNSQFDSFFVGKTKVDGVPAHGKITQSIFNFYANYGITDRLTAIVSLPYITAEGDGVDDPINGTNEQSDLQDLNVMVKYALFKEELKNGSTTYFVAAGGSLPLGYEPNGILSIGNGAPSIDAKIGMHYKNNTGFFGTLAFGYTVRGEADNNLNVGDGSNFDAPNSINSLIKLGYATGKIYVDAWFDSQYSKNNNIDIANGNFFGNFPETQVNYSRVGANVFVPITNTIGLNAGIGTTVDGRNLGNSTTYTGGIIYSLKK